MKWWDEQRLERAQRVLEADSQEFMELFDLAGLDRSKHFRYTDLSRMSFSDQDLSGCDFTGARLHGCDFSGARLLRSVSSSTIRSRYGDLTSLARFERAELGLVHHMTGTWRAENPHAPGVMGPRPGDPPNIANLRAAADWDAYRRAWKPSSNLPQSDDHLPVGAIFQDAPFGPEMVVVPAGEFLMGSLPE